jgi:hypothetical protein
MLVLKCALHLGVALVVAAPLAAFAAAGRPTVGAVDKVQARADAIHAQDVRALAAAASVKHDDLVRTGPAARLLATLNDGTRITLGEKATLLIDDFVYDPAKDGGKLSLRVVEGAFLFVGGRIEGRSGGNVDIATPVGTLGVRGTTVWGGLIDGGYGVLVLDGEVTVSTARGTVTLTAGQGTMVYGPGRDEAPAAGAWPQDRIDRAVATISFRED